MRLADYTDYTLRVLMYCASNPDRLVTIAEIADIHGVSKNHLMKIVNDLARQGVVETSRGRGGGLRLVKPPQDNPIGEVVRMAGTDFESAVFPLLSASVEVTPMWKSALALSASVMKAGAWFASSVW